MKMNINVTTPDETVKHSGKYSIKLESAYPSMFGIGKFAAGNVFVGQYLKTDGTDGVLGFGRPFETPVRPKGLRVISNMRLSLLLIQVCQLSARATWIQV